MAKPQDFATLNDRIRFPGRADDPIFQSMNKTEPRQLKAVIVGAGIGGLSAAIAMQRAGWSVEIFEQAARIEPIGAALSLWPNAVSALDLLGRGEALRAVAQPILSVGIADQAGRDFARFQVDQTIPGALAFLPTRSELQTLLVDGLDQATLHLGQEFEHHSEDDDGVTIRFKSGFELRADFLIAADGIRSRIAERMGGAMPSHAGYGGVVAISDPAPGYSGAGHGTESWGQQERIGVFDLKGDRKYWFYMKNENEAAEAHSVTHGFVERRMRDWPANIRAAIAATPPDRVIPFSVHAKPPPARMARGRIILLGDAAHPMEPNMGQGACQAIEDAVALGAAARGGEVAAIAARYEKLRLRRARRFVTYSRQGSYIIHRLPQTLLKPAHALMRAAFKPVASYNMRSLFRLPDYGR